MLFAVLAAVLYGTSDFLAGLAARTSTSVFGVALTVQAAAAGPVVLVALAVSGLPTAGAVFWGVVAGVGLAFGSCALYLGLAKGAMGVVAPTSAIVSAAVPVLVGLARHQSFGIFAGLGISLAVPALALVAAPSRGLAAAGAVRWRAADLAYGAAAGCGIGASYLGYGASAGPGAWPVGVSLVVSSLVCGAVLFRAWPAAGAVAKRPATAAGFALGGACLAFRGSLTGGSVAISSVLASLYPAVTVLLAAAVLKEPVSVVRRWGLMLSVVALALVAS